jgi:hypothetical protein
MPTQFALEPSAYVPLAIGFFGLAVGYFVWGGQEFTASTGLRWGTDALLDPIHVPTDGWRSHLRCSHFLAYWYLQARVIFR